MPTPEITPKEALDAALADANTAMSVYSEHIALEKSTYEARLAPLIAQVDGLRQQNPKTKKIPLQPGEKIGYNVINRVLEDALRELGIAERDPAVEFWSLVKKMFGPPT